MRSRSALYNIISNLFLQVIVVIYGFIIPKIIIENFGSNVNGLVTSITQFLAYISLLEAGVGPVVKSLLYKPIVNKNKESIQNILRAAEKFFRTIAIIFLIYLVVLCIVYPIIVASEFEFIYTLSLILIISISTFAEYFFGMTYRLYLQADQKNYVISLVQIITYIFNILFIVLFVKLGFSIQLVKLISGLIFIIRPILLNIYIKKNYNINLNEADNNYKLSGKWEGLAQHIAAVIHNNTDVVILTFFSTLIEVSVYSIYSIITRGIKSIVEAFTSGIDSLFGNMLANGEMENLNNKFSLYETVFFTIITIIYICSFILILPFINIYIGNVENVNYIRPVFAILLLSAEFMWSIRLPYSNVIISAGHFKETRIGAWIEALSNLLISLILVFKFGIIGVAIGTLIAMIIRTMEFIYHTNKYILNRSLLVSVKKITIIFIEVILILTIINYLPTISINFYYEWFLYALFIFTISTIGVVFINYLFLRKDFNELIILLKNKIFHK